MVKTGGGGSSVKVVGNKLELVGGGSWAATGIFGPTDIIRALGKGGFFSNNYSTNNNAHAFGFDNSAALDAGVNLEAGVLLSNISDIQYRAGSSGATVGEYSASTEYQFLVLLGGSDSNGVSWKTGDTESSFLYGFRALVKGGAFTNWTLLWIDTRANTSTVYLQFNQNATDTSLVDNILIPTLPLNVDTMFNPIYLDETPDLNVNDIGISDALIDTNVTFGAGVATFQIRFRYQDAANFWNVKALSGTAGTDLTLHLTKTAGGEGGAVASADVDFTAAAHDIRIIVEGGTIFNVYVDGVLELTYAGPDTTFQTETEVQLVDAGTAFTENVFTAHNRTKAAWDTEISTATGSVY